MKARNLSGGRIGTILNGYALEDGRWVEYEVWTDCGIEIWRTADMEIIEPLPRRTVLS